MAELVVIGECCSEQHAALRLPAAPPECAPLRETVGFGPSTRVLLVATEGRTGER
jgi:hypothetical protein